MKPRSTLARVLTALRSGPADTQQLSERTGLSSRRVSARLCYAASCGLVRREPIIVPGREGRPPYLWSAIDVLSARIAAATKLLEANGYAVTKEQP